MKQTIFTGFSPNHNSRSLRTALGFLVFPWKWPALRTGKSAAKVEEHLRKIFEVDHAYTIDSGRSALQVILEEIGIAKGDEVLVQAYTCVVVINAITFAGGVPVYVDIDDQLNMDPADAKKKCTKKTKAIIIQHTFGVSAQMDELCELAKKQNLTVVEDCAHTIAGSVDGEMLGTIGDVALLSFGSDKVISCARGGAIITKDNKLGKKIASRTKKLPKMSMWMLLQHLLHYPFFAIGRRTYRFGFGKVLLLLGKILHITNRIIYPKEKAGVSMPALPAKMPNALATILLTELTKLEDVQEHRKYIAGIYNSELAERTIQKDISDDDVQLDVPLEVEDPQALFETLKKEGVHLGLAWSGAVIVPRDIDMQATQYVQGSCPNAEDIAPKIIQLPNNRHIHKRDAIRIVELVNKYK